jgi:hypothetical protein
MRTKEERRAATDARLAAFLRTIVEEKASGRYFSASPKAPTFYARRMWELEGWSQRRSDRAYRRAAWHGLITPQQLPAPQKVGLVLTEAGADFLAAFRGEPRATDAELGAFLTEIDAAWTSGKVISASRNAARFYGRHLPHSDAWTPEKADRAYAEAVAKSFVVMEVRDRRSGQRGLKLTEAGAAFLASSTPAAGEKPFTVFD